MGRADIEDTKLAEVKAILARLQRMSPDDERMGADLAIHKIGANPEDEVRSGRV